MTEYRTPISPALRPRVAATDVRPRADPGTDHEQRRSSRDVVVVASVDDPTAAYFADFAREGGTDIEFVAVEDLPRTLKVPVGAGAETLWADAGVYIRPPLSDDFSLIQALTVVTDLLAARKTRVVGLPARSHLNVSKPLQTAALTRLGSDVVRGVPTTIGSITDHIGDELHQRCRIVKSISSVRSQVVGLEDERVLKSLDAARCPLQSQPRLEGTDIRVHVCGTGVVATAITSDGTDYRYSTRSAITQVTLPDDVAAWCRVAASAEGLVFAGIDLFFCAAESRYYCFEVNPNPGYHFFEQAIAADGGGYPISTWLLRHLATVDTHRAVDAEGVPAPTAR